MGKLLRVNMKKTILFLAIICSSISLSMDDRRYTMLQCAERIAAQQAANTHNFRYKNTLNLMHELHYGDCFQKSNATTEIKKLIMRNER